MATFTLKRGAAPHLLQEENLEDNFELLSDTSNTVPSLCMQRMKLKGLTSESLSQCCKWMPYCYCKEMLCTDSSEEHLSSANRTACLEERDRPQYCAHNSTSCSKMHDKDSREAVYAQKCPSVGRLNVLLSADGRTNDPTRSSSSSRLVTVITVFVIALLLLGLGLFLWLGGYLGNGGRWSRKRKKAGRSASSKTQHNGNRRLNDGSSERNATSQQQQRQHRQQHHHHQAHDKFKKGSSSSHSKMKRQQSGSYSKPKSQVSHQKATPAGGGGAVGAAASKKAANKQEPLTLKQAQSFNSRQASTVRLKPTTAAAAAAGKGGRIPIRYTKFRNALK